MRTQWKKWLLIPVVAALFAASGCSGGQSTGPATPGTMTLTDQLGRTVSIAKAPQRIISMAPSNTEILYALGLGDKIVAVTDYDDYPADVKQKPSIGGFSTPDFETIVSLSPDLIVAANLQWKDVITQLEAQGVPVLVIDPKTIDQLLDGITLVGKATGATDKAAEVVKGLRKRVDAVVTRNFSSSLPKVLYIVWHDPLMVAGQGTLIDDMIRTAGGINVGHDLNGYAEMSIESVVSANPQVIIVSKGMGEGLDAPFQFAQTDERLKSTDARVNNRVFPIDSNLADRPGPRAIDALEQFAKLIHPELFK